MATIGLDRLYYAEITEAANGDETYGTPTLLAKAITAELAIELLEAILYADDGEAEIVKEFKNGTLSLGIDDVRKSVAEKLTGAVLDDNNVLISTGEDGGNPVAVGFRARKANGKYRYFWLYRVKFGIPSTSLQTKGDSITFSTPTIEGTVMRRNKLDGQNKHPWKAEVDEGDTGVDASTITNWYSAVYEPSFASALINITAQPADDTVTVGSITESLSVTASAASGVIAYQWYSNTRNSTDGGTLMSGETGASLNIPTDLTAGTYYFFCQLSVGGVSLKSSVATVTAVTE